MTSEAEMSNLLAMRSPSYLGKGKSPVSAPTPVRLHPTENSVMSAVTYQEMAELT